MSTSSIRAPSARLEQPRGRSSTRSWNSDQKPAIAEAMRGGGRPSRPRRLTLAVPPQRAMPAWQPPSSADNQPYVYRQAEMGLMRVSECAVVAGVSPARPRA